MCVCVSFFACFCLSCLGAGGNCPPNLITTFVSKQYSQVTKISIVDVLHAGSFGDPSISPTCELLCHRYFNMNCLFYLKMCTVLLRLLLMFIFLPSNNLSVAMCASSLIRLSVELGLDKTWPVLLVTLVFCCFHRTFSAKCHCCTFPKKMKEFFSNNIQYILHCLM